MSNKTRAIMKRLLTVLLSSLLCLTAALAGSGAKALTVGADIAPQDILQFYWTYDASTYPPRYQRYRFFVEDGKHLFFHETREGDHWPLTEADASVTGQMELTADEWQAFLDCLSGGTAVQWEDPILDGDAGPFLFLYWQGDGGVSHGFSFASRGESAAFEDLCEVLKEREMAAR